MSNFPANFLGNPISIDMLARIHAASEERIWYSAFAAGTGEVSSFPFGPIDLNLEHDFGGIFNYSGAPLITISGNEMLSSASGHFNAAPPVWNVSNLPSPSSDTETRLVVQAGKYYFASGGAWFPITGRFPYHIFNSKNQIKRLRLAVSGLLYNVFPFVSTTAAFGYINSGNVQQTNNLSIEVSASPFLQMTGYLYNPLDLLGFIGFSVNRKANKEKFVNIPDRFIDIGYDFAVENQDFKKDTFLGNNIDNISNMLICSENIQPLYTGILQARYLSQNMYDGYLEAARDIELIGAAGADTITLTMRSQISWVGPEESFKIADGTLARNRGAISTYSLDRSITKSFSLDDIVNGIDDLTYVFFSGVSRRGPTFTNFDTPAEKATLAGVYFSLPAVGSAGTKAYTWDGADYLGFVSDGAAWNAEALLTSAPYEQRVFDADNIGIIPSSPSGGASPTGIILEQVNITSLILNSSLNGPNGIKSLYGVLSHNALSEHNSFVDKIQFAKVGESATYPEAPYQSGTLPASTLGNVNLYRIRDTPENPMLVLDGYAFLNWR